MTLEEIAAATAGRLAGGAHPRAVALGASTDSRAVAPGDLFVAVVGAHHDAHDHAAQAISGGAVAVLASRELDVSCVVVDDTVTALGRLARSVIDSMADLVVVGVTGSSGKTSTKDLLAQVLPAFGETLAPVGSFNTEVGLPMTALRLSASTRVLVAEMGARGIGHVRRLTDIARPRIGVVLNVGSAHLGEFGSIEAIAVAKGELVEALPHAGAGGVAVLNADDPLVAAMRSRTTARVVTYGESPDADVRADDVHLDDRGRPSFAVVHEGRRARVSMEVHGRHQVSNALAVAAVALALGLDLDQVADSLSRARAASRWRGDVTDTASGVTMVNDAYNANPGSMVVALELLAAMTRVTPTRSARRSVAVLGEMLELGDRSVHEHGVVGRAAVRLGVDRLVVVGDGEAVRKMRDTALDEGGSAVLVADVGAAVALLRTELEAGDVVLVKASRSVGLDRVAAALLDDVPAAGGAVPVLDDPVAVLDVRAPGGLAPGDRVSTTDPSGAGA
jgi:UDP-N-acetylmuramoyl-tripeptide--D-alanyl-D-alanine ligase